MEKGSTRSQKMELHSAIYQDRRRFTKERSLALDDRLSTPWLKRSKISFTNNTNYSNQQHQPREPRNHTFTHHTVKTHTKQMTFVNIIQSVITNQISYSPHTNISPNQHMISNMKNHTYDEHSEQSSYRRSIDLRP